MQLWELKLDQGVPGDEVSGAPWLGGGGQVERSGRFGGIRGGRRGRSSLASCRSPPRVAVGPSLTLAVEGLPLTPGDAAGPWAPCGPGAPVLLPLWPRLPCPHL